MKRLFVPYKTAYTKELFSDRYFLVVTPQETGNFADKIFVLTEIANHNSDEEAHSALFSTKQDKYDDALQTTHKSIVPAINELKTRVDDLQTSEISASLELLEDSTLNLVFA